MFRLTTRVGTKAHHVKWLAIVPILGVIFALWPGHTPSRGQEKSGFAKPIGGVQPQIQDTVSRALDGVGFGPSLEMRENVDFLLTPAMLVQEAISPDVIPTYPCE